MYSLMNPLNLSRLNINLFLLSFFQLYIGLSMIFSYLQSISEINLEEKKKNTVLEF